MLVGLGWTAEEIARELGGDPETVAARIQRARRAFQEALVRWRR
jgi:DNA-directed RNA polymerase specialized sigma24 family protein